MLHFTAFTAKEYSMKKQPSISLISALFININVIIGAGLFINPRPLTHLVHGYGFLLYLLAALLYLPIIISIAELASHHPTAGGLYTYSSKYLHPFLGFISAWGYFLGKTVSAGLIVHIFITYLQYSFPALSAMPTLLLDGILLGSLITLNLIGLRIGGFIQHIFVVMKFIPIIFVIITGCFYFAKLPTIFTFVADVPSFLSAAPIAAFALMCFEVTCAITHLIDNPQKNARIAIIGSFLIVAVSAALFQLSMFLVAGKKLATAANPMGLYLTHFFSSQHLALYMLNSFVFIALLGSAFAILSSNAWNLFALAKNNHFPRSSLLTKITKTQVPWVALICQGLLSFLFLCISIHQTSLQYMSVFCQFCAYFLSTLAAYIAVKNYQSLHIVQWIPLLGILTSGSILILCLYQIAFIGLSLPFTIVFLTGIILSFIKRNKKSA